MKINEIIVEDQLDEAGNAPITSSDPRVAGGVPQAVANLKARRLARQQQAQPTPTVQPQAEPVAQPPTQPPTQPVAQPPTQPVAQPPTQPPTQQQVEKPEGFLSGLSKGFQRQTTGEYKPGSNLAQSLANVGTAAMKGVTSAIERGRHGSIVAPYKAPTEPTSPTENQPVTKPAYTGDPDVVSLPDARGNPQQYRLTPSGWIDAKGQLIKDSTAINGLNYQRNQNLKAMS